MSALFDTTCFFGRVLPSPAASRNAIGHVIEEFVARVLNVDLLPVDGRKAVCPDFSNGEIKSIGRNKRVLIYKWRLEKEASNFDPKKYFYVFAHHKCPITVSNTSEIARFFQDQPPAIVCVSLKEVMAATKTTRLRKFSLFSGDKDIRIGYNRKGYDQGGWQFSLSKFKIVDHGFKTCTWQGVKVNTIVSSTKGGRALTQSIFHLV